MMIPAVSLRERSIQELLCPGPLYWLSYLNNFIYLSNCWRLSGNLLCALLSLVHKTFIRSVSWVHALNYSILINILKTSSWQHWFVTNNHGFIIFIPNHVCSYSFLLLFGCRWCLWWMILLVSDDGGRSVKASSAHIHRWLLKEGRWYMMLW